MYVFTWRNLPRWCGYTAVEVYTTSLRKAIAHLASQLVHYAYGGCIEQDIAKVLRETPHTKRSIDGRWRALL
jgi:hypothetical protein